MVEGVSTARTFEEFYNAQAVKLLKHCQIRLGDRSKAEEIAQEAFLRTWDVYRKRYGQLDNIRAYLYRIAHNLIVDHFRRASRRREVSLEAILEEQGDSALKDHTEPAVLQDSVWIGKALNTLRPEFAQALTLRYSDELSIPEIARILKKTENATSILLHRAKKALKKTLEQ